MSELDDNFFDRIASINRQEVVIRQADQKVESRWNAYVLNHSEGSAYHLFSWKKAVEKSYGHRCPYLYAEKGDELVGVLPLVHLHFPLVINELVALPYCDIGNCLSQDPVVQDALLSEALALAKQIKAKKVELRGNLLQSDLVQTDLQVEHTGKVRMLLTLPPSSEELLASFKSKLRSQIRKAEKNGITFRWSGMQDLDFIYSVFAENMHLLGSPVHAKSWLQQIIITYKDRVKVGLAEFDGKPVGMGIILLGANSVSIPWASTLREFNRLSPNMLLYWNFLQFSADNGFKTFDFGRSTEGEGTYRFKKQWGAQPVPLPWYSLQESQSQENKPLLPKSNARRIVASTWMKLPLPAANFIGPRMRKYIRL